jgi:hypothetical protein
MCLAAATAAAIVATSAAAADAKVVTYVQPGLQKGRSPITQVNKCNHTGLKGPNGPILVDVYAIKGKKATKSHESCSRGEAAVKAGIKIVDRDTKAQNYIPGKKEPKATYGETVKADGTAYYVDKFEFAGAVLPCFVADGVVFAIYY